jgi:hypothetical protein
MARAQKSVNHASFDAGDIGAVSAEALRRFQALAGTVPPGRFFKTISTLTDLSQQAAEEFEAAAKATLHDEVAEANAHIIKGRMAASRLRSVEMPDGAIPLPDYLRWKR